MRMIKTGKEGIGSDGERREYRGEERGKGCQTHPKPPIYPIQVWARGGNAMRKKDEEHKWTMTEDRQCGATRHKVDEQRASVTYVNEQETK